MAENKANDKRFPIAVSDPKDETPSDPTHELPDGAQASDSGIVTPERDKIVEEHFREHPEGDPAVRRKGPIRERVGPEKKTG